MTPEQIKAKVGTQVTEAEMVDMLKSNPVGTGPDDVKLRSGVLSFSFGRGGVRLTGAEIRTPALVDESPLEPKTTTPGAEKPEPTMFFRVAVSFQGDGDDSPTELGVWQGLATDQADAQRQAMDVHWDSRLDSASCRAVFETEQLPRFLVCDNWGHIFAGTHEQTTRWVMDRATSALVAADVRGGIGGGQWVTLASEQIEDLATDLRDNDVLADPDSWGLEEEHEVPEWATQRAEESSLAGPRDGAEPAERPRA